MRSSFLTSLVLATGLANAMTSKAPTSSSPTSNKATTTSSPTGSASGVPSGCPLDNCFFASYIPPGFKKEASTFCEFFLHSTPGTKTVTAHPTSFATATTTVGPFNFTVVTTTTVTATAGGVCTASGGGTASLSTFVEYSSRRAAATTAPQKRDTLETPGWMMNGCSTKCKNPKAKLSSACACLLTSATVTVTQPTTLVSTAAVYPPSQTVYVTSTQTVTTSACTSTVTPPPSNTAPVTCGTTFTAGPSASISGTRTCANSVPTPSSNVLFRIEGSDSEGTIFEGCIVAGPRNVTTPSGGTHECDGTNAGANPSPGTTPTDQLDAAAKMSGFSFDGTYNNQYQDFYITSISQSTQTGSQYWGILVDGQYTPTGGCQFEVNPGDRSLWAYDAFSKNVFLRVTPDYATAQTGQGTITVLITDDQSGSPLSGASMAGAVSNGAGYLTFPVPSTAGCYQYKATRSDGLRSNAFYLTVVDRFS